MRMQFVVDAQLPPALVRWLTDQGYQAEHVGDVGLMAASDREIWNYTRKLGAVLVTKDEDFMALSLADPAGPPIVWLRVGNTTRRALLETVSALFAAVEGRLLAGEKIIEIV